MLMVELPSFQGTAAKQWSRFTAQDFAGLRDLEVRSRRVTVV